MADFFMMEAANLFCGESEQGKFLTLDELKLPDLVESEIDHTPGGGRATVGVATVVEKLEATFKLRGHDPDMLRLFGLGAKSRQRFTALGAIRNKKTGALLEGRAFIEARLGAIKPDAFKRGDAHGHDYALIEIWHYELYFGGQEQLYFDFLTNELRTGGVDPDPDFNRILQI